MTDLYETLGVPRDATDKTIRKAYHRLAKLYHPDHNPGDAGAVSRYEAVDLAYRILSDPKLREQYDATGKADLPGPDRELAELMSVLSPVMLVVLTQAAKSSRPSGAAHVVEGMRQLIKNAEGELKKSRSEAQQVRNAVLDAVDRFTVHEGEDNFLAGAARAHLAQLDAGLKQLDGEAERLKKAGEFLKKYGYKVRESGFLTGSAGFSASSSSSTFSFKPWGM